MKLLRVLCALLACNFIYETSCQASGDVSSDTDIPCGITKYPNLERIAGGEKAKPYEFPWLVSIQVILNKRTYHQCGGTILNSRFVLTAGHCMEYGKKSMFVLAGKYNLAVKEEHEQKRGIEEVLYDVGYNPDNLYNDIALLKLNESLKLEMFYVVPGCLPFRAVPYADYINTDHAIVAGWGAFKEYGERPDELMKVTLPFIDSSGCRKAYSEPEYKPFMHDCQLCTLDENNKSPCQDDDGGPLMCITNEGKLVICGVYSFGLCGSPGRPAVYTEVSCYVDWITETINSE